MQGRSVRLCFHKMNAGWRVNKAATIFLFVVGLIGVVPGAEPVARITPGTVILAAGATNSIKDAWLDTGADASVLTGAGIVRALMYTATGIVTNGAIRFYVYDAGVRSALYAVTGITNANSASSSRYNLLTNVYCGRIRVEISQQAYTNAANTWTWAAIVE